MKNHLFSFKIIFLLVFLTFSETILAQLPCNVLVGYYQSSWGSYIRLKDVNSNYNVFCISFFEADGGDGNAINNVVNNLNFYATNNAYLLADIPVVQAQGKKVLMSIGGSEGSFKLNTTVDVDTFVAKTKRIITKYGVDGIDIDLEQQTYLNQTGTISNPSAHITNLISGLQQLLDWYQTSYGKKMILTMVPEVAYVTGGLSTYDASTYGVPYLAVIQALSNDIDLLMLQLYNAGSNPGLDGNSYTNGTGDFIVSQTEAVIKGFTCQSSKGVYSGLPESKVVVMLPSDPNGSGYVASSDIIDAIQYLTYQGPRVGSYFLRKTTGYPNLRGMGTWSINVDYDNGYDYANTYASLFTCTATATENAQEETQALSVYPNPAQEEITVEKIAADDQQMQIVNMWGEVLKEQKLTNTQTKVDVSILPSGVYAIKIGDATQKLIIE